MSKQIIVLLGLNAEHKIVESDTGIAFCTGELVYRQWVAIYIAKNRQDAKAAIDYYRENGTLEDFINPERYR